MNLIYKEADKSEAKTVIDKEVVVTPMGQESEMVGILWLGKFMFFLCSDMLWSGLVFALLHLGHRVALSDIGVPQNR